MKLTQFCFRISGIRLQASCSRLANQSPILFVEAKRYKSKVPDGPVKFSTSKAKTWDSIDTLFQSSTFEAQTAPSLLQLLAELAEASEEDIVARIEAQAAAPLVFQGVRREVIRHMALRDQPVLDRILPVIAG